MHAADAPHIVCLVICMTLDMSYSSLEFIECSTLFHSECPLTCQRFLVEFLTSGNAVELFMSGSTFCLSQQDAHVNKHE